MKRVRVWLVTVGLALIAALPAAAQMQTGSILVRVTDEQGAAVPGVNITLTSPVLVAGTMSGVSDAGGVNRFPSLSPGTYSVKIDLQGFRSVIREGVTVQVGQTVPLDMSLRVATVAETVTVTGTSPVVDTTSANTSVNLSEQLLQGTPGGRDIWALVEYKVPSLLITRPDVGGTSGGLQGVFNARGTNSAQNSSYLNGINVGDPAAIGAAGFYYDFDAFDDIQVSTGAHDITVPTSGVFLNMVTKSGGENWRGRTTFAWLGDATQTQNIDDDLLRYGFRPETNAVDFVSDINISAGGPIIARKLRIFTSFRDWRVHVNVPAAFSTLVLDKTDITSGLINANYQMSDNNRLTGLYSRQYYKKPNRFLAASNTLVQGIDQQRRRRLRHLPGAVELGRDAEVLHRRARRAQQDLLPDLPERQRPDAARLGHQHPHPQLQCRDRALARSLPGERHRPVLRRRVRSAAATSSSSASTTRTCRSRTARRASTTST